jgi:formylglycine-generating enzyme required for sulfatase activity
MSATFKRHRFQKRSSLFETRLTHRFAPWVMAGALAILPFSAVGKAMDISSFQINESASTPNTPYGIVLQLTPAKADQAGSVFTKEKVRINKGFSTAFAFQITPSSDNEGAEGFAFVVQNVQPDYVGEASYGLGYYDPSFEKFKQSLAVEFDTWNSGTWAGDSNDNHLGIHTLGDFKGPTQRIKASFKNGNVWYAWIDYDGNQLEVRTSQDKKRPEEPSLVHSVDLTEILMGDEAFVGFTAGTGGSFSQHDILVWRFRERFKPYSSIKGNPWRFQPGKIFQDSLKDGSLGPEMVVIPAGTFRMGEPQSKKVKIKMEQRFAMGRYEVTGAEFLQFVKATGYQTDAEKGNGCATWDNKNQQWMVDKALNWQHPDLLEHHHPVVCVSWNDAVAYANWLTEQTGQKYRLPTEVEWEYAARAKTKTDYWWGAEIKPWWHWCNKNANCWNCGSKWDQKTAPVKDFCWWHKKTKPVLTENPFGLVGILGNVWEWTCSAYDAPEQELTCLDNPSEDTKMTYRGGSFNSEAKDLRYFTRHGKVPTNANENRGIRLVRE